MVRTAKLKLLIAGALLLPAAPAFAAHGDPADMAEKMSDPQAQMAASVAIAAVAQTILDIDISSAARAVASVGGGDAVRDLPPDAKLGDLAGPDARRMPEKIARNVPKAMGSAATMAGAVEDMLPELRRSMKRMKDALPDY